MTTVEAKTRPALKSLINSLQQLDAAELEQVAQQAIWLRVRQTTPNPTKKEADLLLKINEGIVPERIQSRCAALSEKSRRGVITAEEQEELMQLVDEIELLNAKRMGYLAELAALRQISLAELMEQLELKPLSYE